MSDNKKYVYMAMRNSDMTEGRGPMVQGLCFDSIELANTYIDRQPGVMGRLGKWSKETYGDWYVNKIEVLSYVPTLDEKIRAKALSKLTAEEKRVLVF